MSNLLNLSDEDLDLLLQTILKENEGKDSPHQTAGLNSSQFFKDMNTGSSIGQMQSLLHPQKREPDEVSQLAPYIDPRIQSLLRM